MNNDFDKLPVEAQNIVKKLNLDKAYEGIYLKRQYQKPGQSMRPEGTSIYAVAAWYAPSLLHRLDCDELWHFYAGMPLEIYILENKEFRVEILGNDLDKGHKPLVIVPGGSVFGALSPEKNGWCFFGCTCIPGFSSEKCEFIKKDDAILQEINIDDKILQRLTKYPENK